jgi:ribonuclease BN (tRNA processing enzyme)
MRLLCGLAAGLLLAAETRVILLGTGTPNADPARSGPAVAVTVDGVVLLVDAGPGVVRRAAAAGLPMPALNRVFLTHLHSDHTLGLPDLTYSPWTLERADPLEIVGPPGTRAMVRHIEKAWAADRAIRLRGGEPANLTGWRSLAREIRAGTAWEGAGVRVTAIPVPHGNWRYAFGYLFETKDRRIVISGDTAPSGALAAACRGCDVLLHEVYSTSGFARRPPEWQRYHARYHTSARELGELAARARPRLLVLYHQLFWGTSEEELVREVQARFDGKVVSGKDLDVY